jgi:hypothetical protein
VKAGVVKLLKGFGSFWWEFLIGDTPEFALATLVIVGLAFLLDHHRIPAAIVLPLVTAAFLLASALRGRRPSRGG